MRTKEYNYISRFPPQLNQKINFLFPPEQKKNQKFFYLHIYQLIPDVYDQDHHQ
jgi:hypothetical protein